MPAHEFFRALVKNEWTVDPEYADMPKDAQLDDYRKFLNDCRFMAVNGYPERRHVVNNLEDGIWEFKHAAKRLSWYDTDGAGSYVAKHPIENPDDSDYPNHVAWWFPDMERLIRLGYAFPKTGQKAGTFNIAQTLEVRSEDMAHDEQPTE